jgi:hypothetical protein
MVFSGAVQCPENFSPLPLSSSSFPFSPFLPPSLLLRQEQRRRSACEKLHTPKPPSAFMSPPLCKEDKEGREGRREGGRQPINTQARMTEVVEWRARERAGANVKKNKRKKKKSRWWVAFKILTSELGCLKVIN